MRIVKKTARYKVSAFFAALAVAIGLIFTPISVGAVSTEIDLLTAISGATGPTTISVDTDINLSAALTIPAGKIITLTGSNQLIGISGQATIIVNGTLTLNGITVTHTTGATGSGVIVNAGGILTLQSGTISGNTTTSTNGAGVANSGTFNMTGGTISGNTITATGTNGGGVMNNSGATFTMTGGTISGNTANNGGGVGNIGTFNISGDAAITGNTATKDAGGVFNTGTVIMTGGTISGNTAAATAGGVRNNGASASFTMSDGEISGNTSTGDAGGGVMNMNGATFTLSGGKISGNTSQSVSGGGVNNQAATFIMTGGEISGNTGTSGGGVLNWSGASFTMEGGTISNNTTTSATSRGGGIFNVGATVDISGDAIITGNTAVNGGGVWTDSLTNLTVMPGVIVLNNNDISLSNTPVYLLAYSGNGSTSGSIPIDTNFYYLDDEVIVLGQGDLIKAGYIFLGWSTNSAASTAQYKEGDKHAIQATTTLYAVWGIDSPGTPDTGHASIDKSFVKTGIGLSILSGAAILGYILHRKKTISKSRVRLKK